MATNQVEQQQSDSNIGDLTKILIDNKVTPEKLKELLCNANKSDSKISLDKSNLKKCCSDLKLYCNSNEQYNRNWTIRIHGLSVSSELVKKVGADEACITTAYNAIIEPVLRKLTPKPEDTDVNTEWGPTKIDSVPKVFDLLSNGHFVGKKRDNLPRTIIIRFMSRYMRNLFLKYKRKFMPNPTAAETTMGVKFYSAFPDLTAMNHKYLMALKQDPRVKAAWAFDGNLRFSLADSKGEESNETGAGFSEVFFVEDIRTDPTAEVDKAVASHNDSSPSRKSRADLPTNNRQLRSKGPVRGNGGSWSQSSGHGGRSGVPAGRGGVPGGRGGVPGGRGRGRGGQFSGRDGQHAGGAQGEHKDSGESSWQEVKNGATKGEIEKGEGLLPNDNDLACSTFNVNSFKD